VDVLPPFLGNVSGRSVKRSESFCGQFPLGDSAELAVVNARLLKRERGYRSLIDALPHMVGIVDSGAILRYANSQWCAYTGTSVDEHGLPHAGLLVHADDVRATDALLGAIAANCDLHSEIRIRRFDGSYRRHDVRITPLDAQSEQDAAQWMFICTDIEAARTTLFGLEALSAGLARSTASDLATALRLREKTRLMAIVERMSHIGHWRLDLASQELFWSEELYLTFGLPTGYKPTLANMVARYHPDDRDRVADDIREAIADATTFTHDARIVRPDGSIALVLSYGQPECASNGTVIAIIGCLQDVTAAKLQAQIVADEADAAATLEKSEHELLYQRERQSSMRFQRAVLPGALPHVTGCTFDAVYEPGLRDDTVGGDWYDAVHLADGRILVSIGDVAGSGLAAAVVVGVARQIIRGISQLHANPVLILDAADRALRLEYPDVYVSAWVGVIDLVTRTITYASAGHPLPILVSADGTVRELEDATTMLIGMRSERGGQATTVALAQGDALVLYTDGITEAGHDLVAGTQALTDAARTFAAASGRHPAAAIQHQVNPDGSPDDVALLVVRTDFRQAERFIERWTFDVRDGDAAGRARCKFTALLGSRGFSAAACANAELVFGELVGNVVRYASGADVEVAVNYGGVDTVLHVMDHGAGFEHISRLPLDPYAENGRGLFLIAALTSEFTVSERPDGGSHARAVLVRDAA
jgi:PAS domain S-box-containing protein